jgi:tetratricopeptide (TPR) repeat protein
MGKSTLWLSFIAIIVSFAGGFMLANALNRTELASLRAENDRLKNSAGDTKTTDGELTVTTEQIRAAIAEADANPRNFDSQKKHGIGLYQYGALKKNPEIIAEASRLLVRANQLDPKDYEVVLGLAHSYFDTGFYKKENAGFEKAREFYVKALTLKPRDADTQTEVAMTYFLLDPPDFGRAIPEFEKSLQINPKHEKTLQYLGQSLARSNRIEDAEKMLAKLREINPRNSFITELESVITQAKSGQAK